MLIAEQRLGLWSLLQFFNLASHHLIIEVAFRVNDKCGGMRYLFIRAQTHNPAKLQVVVQLLQHPPLRTDPVDIFRSRRTADLAA